MFNYAAYIKSIFYLTTARNSLSDDANLSQKIHDILYMVINTKISSLYLTYIPTWLISTLLIQFRDGIITLIKKQILNFIFNGKLWNKLIQKLEISSSIARNSSCLIKMREMLRATTQVSIKLFLWLLRINLVTMRLSRYF